MAHASAKDTSERSSRESGVAHLEQLRAQPMSRISQLERNITQGSSRPQASVQDGHGITDSAAKTPGLMGRQGQKRGDIHTETDSRNTVTMSLRAPKANAPAQMGEVTGDAPSATAERLDEELARCQLGDEPVIQVSSAGDDSSAARTRDEQPSLPPSRLSQCQFPARKLTLGDAVLITTAISIADSNPGQEAGFYGPWMFHCLTHFQTVCPLPRHDRVATGTVWCQRPLKTCPEFLLRIARRRRTYEQERKMRIPDWSQLSSLLECSGTADQEQELMMATSAGDILTPSATMHHVRVPRATLLMENKPAFLGYKGAISSPDYSRIGEAMNQLRMQAYFLFSGSMDAQIIGGIVAFGHMFTYCEVTRNNTAIVKALTEEGDWDYLPSDVTAGQKEQDDQQEITIRNTWNTPLGQELFSLSGEDEIIFLDSRCAEGQDVLSKIQLRAKELAPEFYSD